MAEPKAKITKRNGYYCAPTGVVVIHFAFGTVVTGDVAKWALADGAAEEIADNPPTNTKVEAPLEKKGRRK